MKKTPITHTSQDSDRKHQQDHAAHNPRATKCTNNLEGIEATGTSVESSELIMNGKKHIISENPASKSVHVEDKRETARHEHTNHFTNRASKKNS